MLDALRKRCEFVDAAAERAGLANVRTLWMRAEDAGRDPTLREVSPLPPASPQCPGVSWQPDQPSENRRNTPRYALSGKRITPREMTLTCLVRFRSIC